MAYTPPALNAVDFALTAFTPEELPGADFTLTSGSLPALDAVDFALTGFSLSLFPSVDFELEIVEATSFIHAYLAGSSSESSSQSAYLAGQATVVDFKSAYLVGQDVASTSKSAYLAGQDIASSFQTAYAQGQDLGITTVPVYLVGQDTGVTSVAAYLNGSVAGTPVVSSVPAYLSGVSPGTPASTSVSAYLAGAPTTRVHAFLAGTAPIVEPPVGTHLSFGQEWIVTPLLYSTSGVNGADVAGILGNWLFGTEGYHGGGPLFYFDTSGSFGTSGSLANIELGVLGILPKSTEWDNVENVVNKVGLKVKGHWWEMPLEIGPEDKWIDVAAVPILSGGSTAYDTIWDTSNLLGENAPIGYVGQNMKQVTHLYASYVKYIGRGQVQLDMSFDHIFIVRYNPGD